jgi:hypothetical protein
MPDRAWEIDPLFGQSWVGNAALVAGGIGARYG